MLFPDGFVSKEVKDVLVVMRGGYDDSDLEYKVLDDAIYSIELLEQVCELVKQ